MPETPQHQGDAILERLLATRNALGQGPSRYLVFSTSCAGEGAALARGKVSAAKRRGGRSACSDPAQTLRGAPAPHAHELLHKLLRARILTPTNFARQHAQAVGSWGRQPGIGSAPGAVPLGCARLRASVAGQRRDESHVATGLFAPTFQNYLRQFLSGATPFALPRWRAGLSAGSFSTNYRDHVLPNDGVPS